MPADVNTDQPVPLPKVLQVELVNARLMIGNVQVGAYLIEDGLVHRVQQVEWDRALRKYRVRFVGVLEVRLMPPSDLVTQVHAVASDGDGWHHGIAAATENGSSRRW